ncbi:hypothetical protein H8D36_00995 [archaeon]|nr:hypothetical protein [archaeon]
MADNPLTGLVGDTFSFNIGNSMYYVAIVVLVILMGISAIWWALRYVKYKYNVIILEEGSDGATLTHITKGAIVSKRNKPATFRLKGFKDANPPIPPKEFIMISPKGMRTVYLRRIGEGEFDYVPLNVHLRNLNVDVASFTQDRKNWMQSEFKINEKLFGGFWDKYGTALMFMGTAIVFLAGIIIIFKMTQDQTEILRELGTQIIETYKSGCGNAPVVPELPP